MCSAAIWSHNLKIDLHQCFSVIFKQPNKLELIVCMYIFKYISIHKHMFDQILYSLTEPWISVMKQALIKVPWFFNKGVLFITCMLPPAGETVPLLQCHYYLMFLEGLPVWERFVIIFRVSCKSILRRQQQFASAVLKHNRLTDTLKLSQHLDLQLFWIPLLIPACSEQRGF